MGKKPVLGLVGLCVGLALSGCKNCGCGWSQKKADHGHAVSRVQKDTQFKTEGDVATQDPRKRTTTDRGVVKGGEAVHSKHPYDLNKDSYHPTVEQSSPQPFVKGPASRTTVPEKYDAAGIGPEKDPNQAVEYTETKQTSQKPSTIEIPPSTPPIPERDAALNSAVAEKVPPGKPEPKPELKPELKPEPELDPEADVPQVEKDKVLNEPRPLNREVAPSSAPTLPQMPPPVEKKKEAPIAPPSDLPELEGPPVSGSETSTPAAPKSDKAPPTVEESAEGPALTPTPPTPPTPDGK